MTCSHVIGFGQLVGWLAVTVGFCGWFQPAVAQSDSATAVTLLQAPPVSAPLVLGELGAETRGQLRCISYNIRYATEADGLDAWRHRADTVATAIAEADVIGLQEALQSQVSDLQARLAEHDWWGVGRDDGEAAGEFVPIFYRRERFERVDGGHFWLSLEPQRPGSRSWDAAITRMVSWLELKDLKTEQIGRAHV